MCGVVADNSVRSAHFCDTHLQEWHHLHASSSDIVTNMRNCVKYAIIVSSVICMAWSLFTTAAFTTHYFLQKFRFKARFAASSSCVGRPLESIRALDPPYFERPRSLTTGLLCQDYYTGEINVTNLSVRRPHTAECAAFVIVTSKRSRGQSEKGMAGSVGRQLLNFRHFLNFECCIKRVVLQYNLA